MQYLRTCQDRINHALSVRFNPFESGEPLHQAMAYSMLSGGKRLRAALIYAIGEALGANEQVLTQTAVAIECMHAFSLIHDDLPALDNDDLRRGRPTCHLAFGESTAILAGDALQSLAFEIVSELTDLAPVYRIEMIRILARGVGALGMIRGESLDVGMVNQTVTTDALEEMYYLKTGGLLEASLRLGALAAGCDNLSIHEALQSFAKNMGVAFQIHDDIIGIESDTATLGKKQHADITANKPVYPVLVGMQPAKDRCNILYEQAIESVKNCPIDYTRLIEIAQFIIQRNF